MNNEYSRRNLTYLGPVTGSPDMFGSSTPIPKEKIESAGRIYPSIRDFERISRLLEKPNTDRPGSLVDRLYANGRHSTGTYISDVFQCGDAGVAKELCANFQQVLRGQYSRGLYIISLHGNHVHIVHDCPYSDRSCRCSFIKKAQSGIIRSKRPFRRAPRINSLKVSDYVNIILYFTSEGRQIYEIRLAGQMEEVPSGDEYIRLREAQGPGLQDKMEGCFNKDSPELRRETPCSILSARPSQRYRESISTKSKASEKIQQLVLDMCIKYPCSPINGIVQSKHWLLHKDLQFLGNDDFKVKAGMTAFSNRLCSWSFDDYNAMYTNKDCEPLFTSTVMPFDDTYYNLSDSLQVLVDLLELQFDKNDENICKFLTDLYNILDRKIPKRNCIIIYSPPSGGKNYFCDVFIDYFLNKGQFGNANKTNNFPFQDGHGKRIVLWNEPNYERSQIDTIKMITAGDAYSVNVKMKSNSAVSKTPIIVLTNNHVDMMSNPAFKDRCYVYKWKTAPFLKDYKKKPNPIVAYNLLKHYNIIKI